MSRLIVKNLPNGIKEERLKHVFGKYGNITDCSLKYSKSGQFRKFGFVGFTSPEEAQAAIAHFNGSFLDASKIQVEIAKDLGDSNKPRAWSKYSKESSAYQKKNEPDKPKKENKKETRKKKSAKEEALEDMLGDLKDDPGFDEFLKAHQRSGQKNIWDNDASVSLKGQEKGADETQSEIDAEGDSGNEEMDEEENEEKTDAYESTLESEENKVSKKKSVSDLDYLKSKVNKDVLLSDSDSEDDGGSEDRVGTKKANMKTEEDESSDSESEEDTKEDGDQVERSYVVKMKGLQFNIGEKSIKDFFQPIKIVGIKIPRNAKRKPIGIAFVRFSSEKDLNQAMGRNKSFIGTKRVFLKKCTQDETKESGLVEVNKPRPWELKIHSNENDESIAESGRLYVRNLAYTCTEEDLQTLFEKYGPLTEIHLPVDAFTKKIKGFAFLTFMMPEHAVKAFTELDGTTFMGRLLHILPGKEKKEDVTVNEGSSYKNQKQTNQKANASSSHNWNTLFLGANAVADAMAAKYGTEKKDILDAESSESLGVRMALGETQIVAETRDFLMDNGVSLDCFSQPSGPRSKSVILAKNLPAGTKSSELQDIFSKYGTLGRVLLPPAGITAIVEFLEPSEAKAGFRNLAYTKFHHVPLYLEWAPVEVFRKGSGQGQEPMDTTTGEQDKKVDNSSPDEESEESSSEGETTSEPGSTLFVKNLNFDTTEENLKQKFSKCGDVMSVTIAKKKDMKNPGQFLSLGYGFVEYKTKASADKALKSLQNCKLDDHTLELKVSNREVLRPEKQTRKKAKRSKQTTSKILVRNIPFEAKQKELFDLFRVFGQLKTVRLPKKLSGTGTHRGFGFVDFHTKEDAKRAFESLCHSTHLYGRRLVLEWAEEAEDIEDLRKKTAEHFHDEIPSKKFKKSAIKDSLEGL